MLPDFPLHDAQINYYSMVAEDLAPLAVEFVEMEIVGDFSYLREIWLKKRRRPPLLKGKYPILSMDPEVEPGERLNSPFEFTLPVCSHQPLNEAGCIHIGNLVCSVCWPSIVQRVVPGQKDICVRPCGQTRISG